MAARRQGDGRGELAKWRDDLGQRFRDGDAQALAVVVKQLVPVLVGTLRRRHPRTEWHELEDCVSVAVWDAWERRRSFQSRGTIKGWLLAAERRRVQPGFTIIELLIVVFVVGLLLSLALPAVQGARESSRRAVCENNLRQIGAALQNFESSHGHYPNAFCGVVDWPDAHYKMWCVSPSAQMAAFLDGGPGAEQIDTARAADRWDPTRLALDAPPVLDCPSDPLARGRAASYRYCRGILPIYPGDPGGVFTAFIARRPADVRDGLSNTAFASERLIGTAPELDRWRDPLLLPAMNSSDLAPSCIAANQGTGTVLPPVPGVRPMGTIWTSGSWVHSVYYHFFPPNTPWRDCLSNSGNIALVTARSNHPPGVNVLFGDGRVQLGASDMDLRVWRAWATRSGGEAL